MNIRLTFASSFLIEPDNLELKIILILSLLNDSEMTTPNWFLFPPGIGYFTLPYLVHAQAAHVHACEWNPHAVSALRQNLRDNNVSDRCTVHEGDSRQVCLTVSDFIPYDITIYNMIFSRRTYIPHFSPPYLH